MGGAAGPGVGGRAGVLVGTELGAAFLEHLLEALEPHSGQLRLHPLHVRLVLLGELHGDDETVAAREETGEATGLCVGGRILQENTRGQTP
jgi:hypothetical protein